MHNASRGCPKLIHALFLLRDSLWYTLLAKVICHLKRGLYLAKGRDQMPQDLTETHVVGTKWVQNEKRVHAFCASPKIKWGW
jgi:hypothetical protein